MMIIGNCKECGCVIRDCDAVPSHPNVYECQNCCMPQTKEECQTPPGKVVVINDFDELVKCISAHPEYETIIINDIGKVQDLVANKIAIHLGDIEDKTPPLKVIRTTASEDNYGPDVIGDVYFDTPGIVVIIIEPPETKIKFADTSDGKCPHGYEDWDDCPDCRH